MQKKKLLVVGGTGFVGSNIKTAFGSKYDLRLTGWDVDVKDVDVRDAESLNETIASFSPDDVIHLAAISTIRESIENLRETYEVNFLGTLNLLMALRQCQFTGKVLYVGSSQVYGTPSEIELPVTEKSPIKPLNPYAVSKIAADALCYQWSQTENFEITMARPFNHIGPGQSDRFAVSNFARQIAEICLGRREPVLRVGNIDVRRDFTDVRDVVRAYDLLLANGKNGESYNVCSGIDRSIRFVVEQLIGIADIPINIEQVASRMRPNEQQVMRGSFAKLTAHTGWEPLISIEKSLEDIYNDWMHKLK